MRCSIRSRSSGRASFGSSEDAGKASRKTIPRTGSPSISDFTRQEYIRTSLFGTAIRAEFVILVLERFASHVLAVGGCHVDAPHSAVARQLSLSSPFSWGRPAEGRQAKRAGHRRR